MATVKNDVSDSQTFQSLLDNNTITPKDQLILTHTLNAIQSYIKEDEHFWHFTDEVMNDFHQQPNKQIYALNTRITMLVSNCKFQNQQTGNTPPLGEISLFCL